MALPEKLLKTLAEITTPTELAHVLKKHKSAGSRIMNGKQDVSRAEIKTLLDHYSKLNYKMFL